MEQLHNLVEDAMQESGSNFESGKTGKSTLGKESSPKSMKDREIQLQSR